MAQHLALPFTMTADGRLQTLTQDSPAEVAQSVALLLSTRAGERLSVPNYGTPPALFAQRVNTGAIGAALEAWEPRAAGYQLDVDVTRPESPVVIVSLPTPSGTTTIVAGSEAG